MCYERVNSLGLVRCAMNDMVTVGLMNRNKVDAAGLYNFFVCKHTCAPEIGLQINPISEVVL